MTRTRSLTAAMLLGPVTFLLTMLQLSPAGASASSVAVTLHPAAATFAAGSEAAIVVRVTGDDPEAFSLDLRVESGTLSGVVAPNLVEPGVAEGMAFVHRAQPGVAVLRAFAHGVAVATVEVTFISDPSPTGSEPLDGATPAASQPAPVPMAAAAITARVVLEADTSAAARTWRIVVLDATGASIATLQPHTSGDRPIGTAVSASLPPGRYTVQFSFGADTAASCGPNTLFRLLGPAIVTVDLASGTAVDFAVAPCPVVAPATSPETTGNASPVASAPAGQPEARPGDAPTPAPPATGTGTALLTGRGETPGYLEIIGVLFFFVTITATGAARFGVARSRR